MYLATYTWSGRRLSVCVATTLPDLNPSRAIPTVVTTQTSGPLLGGRSAKNNQGTEVENTRDVDFTKTKDPTVLGHGVPLSPVGKLQN